MCVLNDFINCVCRELNFSLLSYIIFICIFTMHKIRKKNFLSEKRYIYYMIIIMKSRNYHE